MTAKVGPGAVLGGRYRLERLLGTGGMASVWLGRDQRLGRAVAIKVLGEVLALDEGFVRRFAREARIAAGLSHPGLVRVYDFGTDAERPYLVMDYVEGGTLGDRPAGSVDAGALAAELLGALAHMHAAGIIHRDIKPANVLIDDEGRARLTDFGIARPENATQITKTGEVIGTLRYMAPEVREGGPATERSDLYACGALLEEQLAWPRDDLAELVERLTERDPAARPASAATALGLLGGTAEASAAEAQLTESLATERIPPTAQRPVSGMPSSAEERAGGRELTVAPAAALAALAGLAGLILLLVVLLDGGNGSSGRDAAGGASAPKVKTTTTTTAPPPPALTTTVTTTAPAPEPKVKKPKPEDGRGPGGQGPPGLQDGESGDD